MILNCLKKINPPETTSFLQIKMNVANVSLAQHETDAEKALRRKKRLQMWLKKGYITSRERISSSEDSDNNQSHHQTHEQLDLSKIPTNIQDLFNEESDDENVKLACDYLNETVDPFEALDDLNFLIRVKDSYFRMCPFGSHVIDRLICLTRAGFRLSKSFRSIRRLEKEEEKRQKESRDQYR